MNLKNFARKSVGLVATLALSVATLVALPAAAVADETTQPEPPSTVVLNVSEVRSDDVDLTADLDAPLEESQTILNLYRENDPVALQTVSTGEEVILTIPKPTATAYEQYYVTVGSLKSNLVTVASNTSTWEVSLSTFNNVTSFNSEEATPALTWQINQTLTGSNKKLYITDRSNNSILYTNTIGDAGSWSPPSFTKEKFKDYYIVIADNMSNFNSVTDLTNQVSASNSVRLTRAEWEISLASNTESFSTSDPDPILTWTTNQLAAPYYKTDGYGVFIADSTTEEIVYTSYTSTPTTTNTYSARFFGGGQKNYVAYVAEFNLYALPSTVDELVGVQAVSNSVSLQRSSWTLTTSIDQASFNTDSPTPQISWETNQSISGAGNYYNLFFADKATGEIIYRQYYPQNLGSSGYVTIPRFYNGEPREYVGFIAKNPAYHETVSNVSQLVEIQATSNTTFTERADWEVTIGIDKNIFSTNDSTPVVHWEANQSISGSGNAYRAYLVDTSTNNVVNSSSNQASFSGDLTIDRPYTGGLRNYQVYIAKSYGYGEYYATASDLIDIQAISNTVSVERAPWSINISIDRSTFLTDEPTPVITWVADQSIVGSNYAYKVYLIDTETNNVVARSDRGYYSGDIANEGSFTIPRFYTGPGHTFKAYVAKSESAWIDNLSGLTDIQASSESVYTERTAWTVSAGIDRTVFSTDDPRPVITWETNQTVQQANYNYIAYLIDDETEQVLDKSYKPYLNEVRNSGIFTVGFDYGGPKSYTVYIAKGASSYYGHTPPTQLSELEDIQAVSESVTTKRAAWNIRLETVDITYGGLQDSDPNNDAATYTLEWSTNQINNRNYYDVYVFANPGYQAWANYSWNYTGHVGHMTYYSALNTAPTSFTAYVAKKTPYGEYAETPADLIDIQAVSNVVNPGDVSEEFLAERYKGGANPSEVTCNQQCYGDPVNSYNGEFFENSTDLSLSSAIPFEFSRSYSTSSVDEDKGLGNGWNFNYGMNIEWEGTNSSDSDVIKVVQENGAKTKYTKAISDGQEIYATTRNTQATLVYNEDTNKFIFQRQNNMSFFFNADNGKLEQIKDLNDNTLNFIYTNNKLSSVVNNANKTLTINWTGNRITSVSDGTRTVSYTFNSSDNLSIVDLPETVNHKQYVYDSGNRITSVVHENGGVYRNYYDSEGRVEKQIDPLNGEMLFDYSVNETTITLPDGNIKKEIYNFEGQLVETKFAVGTDNEITYSYEYDYTGQVWRETDPTGNYTTYTHDRFGNTISMTNANYRTATFTYNALNQLVETTNALGKKSLNTYDAKGNLIASKDFNGKTTTYEVNPNGTNASIASPNDIARQNNKKSTFTYDVNGHLNGSTQPEGGAVSIVNDNLGNPLSSTNSLNQTVNYIYDSSKRLVETKDPNQSSTRVEYDNAGRIVKQIDVDGNEMSSTYDLMDRILTTTTDLGTVEYDYNSVGQLLSITDADGGTISYTYDELGRTLSSTDPKGNVSTNTYYDNSLLETSTDSMGETVTYEYDAVGNLIKTTDPLGNISTAQYDALNRALQSVSSNGYAETYTYDNNGNVTQVVKANLETTKYEYDDNNNLVKTIYPDNSFEERVYDSNDSMISMKDRDGNITSYEFNSATQLVKTVRPDSSEVNYAYTNIGNLDSISYDNWTTIDTKYVYDIAGRVIQEFKNGVETTYAYDAIGNLTRRGPPTGAGVEYEYDQYGKIVSLLYPSGIELNYTYDANKNLTKIESDDDSIVEYEYDENNRQIRADYSNGTFEEKNYDELNRLTDFSINNATSELYQKSIELRNDGFIIGAETKINGTTTNDKDYSYTANQRLSNAKNNLTNSDSLYGFDTSSNLTSSASNVNTFTANGKILTSDSGSKASSYAYDLRGNRTNKTITDNTTQNTLEDIDYTWSDNNKLSKYKSQVNDPTISNNFVVTEAEYSYDASGLLVDKSATTSNYENNLLSSETSTESSYVWDKTGVPSIIEDNENLYIYGTQTSPVAQINKDTDEIAFLHGDERDSVIAATTESGDLSWTKEYDEYGANIDKTPISSIPQIETNFAYAGEYLDSDTGLYNLRARWYEPSTASFISIDPALIATGEAYSYASANPLSNTDPLGLWTTGDTTNAVVGAIDGFIGIAFASTVANMIMPGSILTCSVAYTAGNTVGTVTSFFVPASWATKSIGLLAKIGNKILKFAASAKTAKQATKVVATTQAAQVAKTANVSGKKLPAGYGGRNTSSQTIKDAEQQTLKDIQADSVQRRFKDTVYDDAELYGKKSYKSNGRKSYGENNHSPMYDWHVVTDPNVKSKTQYMSVFLYHGDHRGLSTTNSSTLAKDEAHLPIEEVVLRDIVEMKMMTVGGPLEVYDKALNSLIKHYNIQAVVRPDGVYLL